MIWNYPVGCNDSWQFVLNNHVKLHDFFIPDVLINQLAYNALIMLPKLASEISAHEPYFCAISKKPSDVNTQNEYWGIKA